MDILEQQLTCALCGTTASADDLSEALWLPPGAVALLESRFPGWQLSQGACPVCVQRTMLETLIAQADTSYNNQIQAAFPLNAEAVFGVLPTTMRLHADPRYTGKGVTIAFVDSAFYPHPDLVLPRNRIRAYVDATAEPVYSATFGPDESPQWPGWDNAEPAQWHGMMTSSVAAGNGRLSHGLYRALACEADLVLLRTMNEEGRIGNESITRALRWLAEHAGDLNVRVVSISVAGEHIDRLIGNPVDEAVQALVSKGIVVVVAAGNAGERRLVPPATSPEALTVGGLDDRNNFDEADVAVWHSNYGGGLRNVPKPELVAPSIWVVAPVLPGSEVAREAEELLGMRPEHNTNVEQRIAQLKLVTPHYQHVEGTSFAAPLVSSVVACMLEANPTLTPRQVRDILIATAMPVEGASHEQQGAGAVVPARAIGMALREPNGALEGFPLSPQVAANGMATFILHDTEATRVNVQGSWDDWAEPGIEAKQVKPHVWQATIGPLEPGRYRYKFLLDGERWLDDPDNPHKEPNTLAAFDSVLEA
jgi:serine protease AprX